MKPDEKKLRRTLSFTQVVLYGLGTTIGAGVYALLGEIAHVSGVAAPLAFLIAAGLAALTAFSFARMVSRYPRAAGAALYVQKGFDSWQLALATGLLVVFAGLVSSAALLNGLVGYAQDLIDLDRWLILVVTAACIGAIASWGIGLSAWVAGMITLIEVGGLLWATSLASSAVMQSGLPPAEFWADVSFGSTTLILSGAVLAFYAFIGFEDMIEIAEEVKEVRSTLPKAILTTLGLSALLYFMLVTSAVLAVGPQFLAVSKAPLSDLVARLSNVNPALMSAIGIFAIVNGALIQLIMSARVLYGLAARGQIPTFFAQINRSTQTPVITTLLCVIGILTLAVSGSIDQLARSTSLIILVVFTLVNLSFVLDENRQSQPQRGAQLIGLSGAAVCAVLAGIALLDLFVR
jgi:amino acid transporter